MSLSIKDFSEMSELSPQTLRFYHSEGLLVPAVVDEDTGYRYYDFEQVQDALLVSALRGTGMSVRDVRRALDAPDTAAALLDEHTEALDRQREAEDEAITTARSLLTSWPEVRRREVPEKTVLSAEVKAVPVDKRRGQPDQYDWDAVTVAVRAAVADLGALAVLHGAKVEGVPWFTWAGETHDQREAAFSTEGPHWLAKVPVSADAAQLAALAEHVDVQTFEAREELAIHLPGRLTMSKHATAQLRLVTQVPEGLFPDASTQRHILHDDGIETAVRLSPLRGART
ncbi:MerR family transcriptional regulator [Nocardiopsis sp. NPDC058789]|uniref:MerR family transcriptional regulator n=1 Tax=Nocardiopsis eucommiae TaxID=2831970 RepID=A0A975LBY0_9ACTN|nr:MerR family transcriptional regulator [Nocardiopsis eucommiae]